MTSLSGARSELKLVKTVLTKLLNKALEKKDDEVDINYFLEVKLQAKAKFEEVLKVQKTVGLYICNMESVSEDAIDTELQAQVDKDTAYNDKTSVSLARLADRMAKLASTPLTSVDSTGGVATSSVNIKLPELKIASFADNSNDSFEFFRFCTSFNNALNSFKGVTKAVKLVYLKSYLQGRALALVENLPIEDDNYDLAWSLLRSEFFL